MKELLELVVAAGHADFRDARGPLQLSQRQAAGKFTRDEADLFINRLVAESEARDQGAAGTEVRPEAPSSTRDLGRSPAVPTPRRPKAAAKAPSLEGVASEVLAAELQSRGWVVLEP